MVRRQSIQKGGCSSGRRAEPGCLDGKSNGWDYCGERPKHLVQGALRRYLENSDRPNQRPKDALGFSRAKPGSLLSAGRKRLVSDAIARQHHRTASFSKFELS